jgi:hypothetical protein
MSDDAGETRTEAAETLKSKLLELDSLISGRTRIAYESRLAKAQEALEQENAKQAESQRQFEARLEALNEVHVLRRALLSDLEAVEFVRGDPEWLRVMLLMYGGLPDTHLAGYVTQYSEIANILQLPDATRDWFVSQLRNKPYWRQKWEGDDVFYNLAVYLDTECGKGAKAAAKATLAFDPLYIFLDSVLTPILLPGLRKRLLGKSMIGPLIEVARRPNAPLESASALLALLAIDPASAFDELVGLCRDGARREIGRTLRDLIQQRLGLLRDGTVLYTAAEKLGGELDNLAGTLLDEQFEDLLLAFYRPICEALQSPPATDPLTSWMNLPYANAELWGSWMSGCRDDARYNFEVVLDVIGKKLHSADALANLHRAHTVRFQQFTTWALDFIPPVWKSLSDMCGEAFTIAQESTSLVLEDLFHVGTIGYSGVDFEQSPDLHTEALAATLMLPAQSFEVLLSYLSTELAEKSHYEIERTVIDRARAIADPVVRTRALWRVGRFLLQWGEVTLFDEAISAAATLADPLQRARAYERLVKDAPLAMRPPLLQRLRETVRAIPDTNNRVRALCRLAILSGGDESTSLCREAVELLGSVKSSADRVETLVLMRRVFADNQLPQFGLDQLAETEPNSWYRHKAMGLLSFELAKIHPSMRHWAEATPMVLYAILLDVLALLDRSQEANESWLQLTRPDQREAAFAALLADIARADAGTLPFTKTARTSLTFLAVDGGAPLAAELLPHLTLSRSREFPDLHGWLQEPPHECLRPYAGLMLAESGRLDAFTLPQVLELLHTGKDIARYRAALVLHSDHVYIGKPDPRHRASALGLEGILSIGEFTVRMAAKGRHGQANTARWTWVNTVFDSPQIIEGLVRCIHDDPVRRQAAAGIVENLHILTEASAEKFVELLLLNHSGPAAVPLLKGFCTLCNKNLKFAVPMRYEVEVAGYWNALSEELAKTISGLPNRIESVKQVLLNGIADSLSPAALDAALLGGCLIPPKNSPQEIGECSVYRLVADPPAAQSAAKEIADSSVHLRALFVWLAACLSESIEDPSDFLRKRATLLEIASHCGQHSPAAVFNLVEELDLENVLVNAAVHQPSFNGRAGAITLLGHIRNPGRGFLTALKSAMMDTAEVQQAALAMVRRLRYVSSVILTDLIELLEDEDATMVYAASRLLAVIARHEKTDHADRKRIARALSSALKGRSGRHTACAFEHASGRMWISKLGTLAQRHYQSLLEIVSIC